MVVFLLSGCYVSVGAGVTRPIQGDVDRHIAPVYSLSAGFAWDFGAVFAALGAGGHAAGQYRTNADPDQSVAPFFVGEGRLDVTVAQRRLATPKKEWTAVRAVLRWTNAVSTYGCVGRVGAESMEAGCSTQGSFHPFKAWSALTAALAVPGKGNFSVSLGPMYWQGGQDTTGPVRGAGLEARLTYHFAGLRSMHGAFKGIGDGPVLGGAPPGATKSCRRFLSSSWFVCDDD